MATYHFDFDGIRLVCGYLIIADLDFYRSGYLVVPVNSSPIIKTTIKQGSYSVSYYIENTNTCNSTKGKRNIIVTSGILTIGDPGHLVLNSDWDYFEKDIIIDGKENATLFKNKAILINQLRHTDIHYVDIALTRY